MAGRRIPIPFSETSVSPDKLSVRYTKNPSKIKLNIIDNLFKTNCSCLFWYIKTLINVSKDTIPNNDIYIVEDVKKTGTSFPTSFHRKKTKGNIAVIAILTVMCSV